MNKETLIEFMDKALKENKSIAVEITIPGCESPEIIINPPENIAFKKNYYLTAYNDKLEHNYNKDIKITNISILNTSMKGVTENE